MISFKSLTRQTEIGANCYLLKIGNKRILIDAGMHPKEEGKKSPKNKATMKVRWSRLLLGD